MKGGKISFFSNLYVILIHRWNNLLYFKIISFISFFSPSTTNKQAKEYSSVAYVISLGKICLFSINTTAIICISILCIVRLICWRTIVRVEWSIIVYWIIRFISGILTPIPAISVQIIILVLLLRKAFSQLVFVFASKTNEKDLIISCLLSFRLFGRKAHKYIPKAISFSTYQQRSWFFQYCQYYLSLAVSGNWDPQSRNLWLKQRYRWYLDNLKAFDIDVLVSSDIGFFWHIQVYLESLLLKQPW